MSIPFFSVIMPVYNRSKFLDFSITSVLEQDFTDFELICIDDKSTDDSLKLIEKYVAKDQRVKIYRHTENSGRCAARNSGLKMATAKWVCFLDSDDFYLRNHLSVFHKLIFRFPNLDAFATLKEITSTQIVKQPEASDEKLSLIRLQNLISTNLFSPNVLCYNREKIKITFGDENIPVSEDWLFARNLLAETNVVKTSVVTTILSEHPDRTMNTQNINEIVKWNEYTGMLFSNHPKLTKQLSDSVKSITYLLCANMLISNGNKKDSVSFFKKSLKFMKTFRSLLFYKYLLKYMLK